ncbi:hypothetical protein [Kordia jejudonensis]|uniref:hypothetical protein n=1 Tax=Kordia jejudonensis TaxID=1348245 RepID=UPI0006290B72|nr:hypothetical protein [Kordia jejudonensis]
MKNSLKLITYGVLISVFCISCASLPISERKQEFIILKNKDTIYGDKVRGVKWFNKLGRVTVINGTGENEVKKVYPYDEIYQIHYYDRKNRKTVQEIVEENPEYKNTHMEMDVVINEGKVKLYKHDPGQWADRPFVVSDIFYGYAYKSGYKQFLKQLDKCEAFREKFTEKEQRRRKYLAQLIEFYNANCD